MSDKPLMPKATAVWLIDNTSLTFEQIAAFCGLHELEVQAIADAARAERDAQRYETEPARHDDREHERNPAAQRLRRGRCDAKRAERGPGAVVQVQREERHGAEKADDEDRAPGNEHGPGRGARCTMHYQ